MPVNLPTTRTTDLSQWTPRPNGSISLNDPLGTVGGGGGGGGSPAVQFASGYWMASALTARIIHPRPAAETSAWAKSKRWHPGIIWRLPVGVIGLAKPVSFSVNGPAGMRFLEAFPTLTGSEYIISRDNGMLQWDNPTVGSHSYTITAVGQDGTELTVTTTLTVSADGFVVISPDGNDANPGTYAQPKRSIETFFQGGSFSGFENRVLLLRGGAYAPAGLAPDGPYCRMTGNASKGIHGVPGELPVITMSSAAFVMDSGADLGFSNLRLINSNTTLANSRVLYSTSNHADGHRQLVYDVQFDNFGVGTSGSENAAPYSILAPGNYRDDIYVSRIDLTNISSSPTSSVLGSWYHTRYCLGEHINIGSGCTGERGVLFKAGNRECAFHHVDSLGLNIGNGILACALEDNAGITNDNIEFAFNRISWDQFNGQYALRYKFSDGAGTPNVYIFRNNIRGPVGRGGATGGAANIFVRNNVVVSQWGDPIHDSVNSITVTDENNLVDAANTEDYFDADLNLQNGAAAYIGQRGAQMASGV